jgi:hypothetical protein
VKKWGEEINRGYLELGDEIILTMEKDGAFIRADVDIARV